MENILKHRFNCFNLSTIGDGSIIDFNKDNGSSDVVECDGLSIYISELCPIQ